MADAAPLGVSCSLNLQLDVGPALGSGTSGVVSPLVRAIDGGRYAVKTVKRAAGQDGAALHEIRLHRLCSADCGAIVRYAFASQTEDALLVIMEACDLELWGALRGGGAAGAVRPTAAELEAWTASLCDALRHCHSLRVMHRDVSPWNVLLVERAAAAGTTDGSRGAAVRYGARLADFGLAVQLPGGTEELRGVACEGAADLDESAMGSLYSAPELGKCYGFKADAFSLGMTLLAMWAAAGCPDEDSLIDLVEATKAAAVQGGLVLSELLPDLPHSTWRALILGLLDSVPSARPTAAEAHSVVHPAPGGEGAAHKCEQPAAWRLRCIHCLRPRKKLRPQPYRVQPEG